MTVLCKSCKKPIPALRLEILPETKECVACSKVVKPVGFMVYSHKTAPVLVTIEGDDHRAIETATKANARKR